METETIFTNRDMRNIFAIDESTFGRWRKFGKGPAFQVGGWSPGVYYTSSAIAEWTAAQAGGRWPEGGKFLSTRLAAKRLGITPAALRQRRSRKQPPHPVYFEGIPRYLPEDCESQEIAK